MTTPGTTRSATQNVRTRDRTANWGLLGLPGLIGLVGLANVWRRNRRPAVPNR
ncbi:hypothetical protein Oscil6304_5058 [Oscillatoria acuminata PCC 6304]|uniref:Uncharacterized protein n=2 Tax=Oscillatoria acuminata TaxID=118323 RepID=K9TPS4_9CYAN|nr:hypothetical protein Oscil6304_5058 [Oscillatoria acuminata PCC 6304]